MQIFWGLSLYFKVRNSVFSYVVKSFWYALILLRHTWIKTEKKGVSSKTIYHIRQNRVIYLKIKLEMAINAHFCQFSSSASFSSLFFVYLFLLLLLLLLRLLLLLLLILLLLLLNDQIANLFGAFILCKVSNSVFSYGVKNFWYDPLFCCVIHELRPKGRGRIKNFLPHKTKQSSFPWNKARNGILCFFLFCVIFFAIFFVLLLPLILLLLLLLLPLQCINGYIRVKLG